MIEPYENAKVRAAWATLRAESLNEAARRLAETHPGTPDITGKVLKNERFRNPDGFPPALQIGGRYHNSRLSVYSGAEVDLWLVSGRDIRNRQREYDKLHAQVLKAVERAQPVQLSHAATVLLPDVDEQAAVRRVRSWKENRQLNGFPEPLPVNADYVITSMVFSMVELAGWRKECQRRANSPEAIEARQAALRARAYRSAATRAAKAAAEA